MSAQPSSATTTPGGRREANAVVADLIRFLETGTAPARLFAADAFADPSSHRSSNSMVKP